MSDLDDATLPTSPYRTVARRRVPVVAPLNYLRRTGVRPRSYASEPPPGVPWENAVYDAREVRIDDIRDRASRPLVDREGFELWTAPSRSVDFLDDDSVRHRYYPQALELALAVTGATRGHVFDHLVRRREADRPALGFGRKVGRGAVAANGRIHNDYTEASGRRRLELVVTDPDARRSVRRHAIVNLWRPTRDPVLDTPLALCDARTVAADDLVEGDVVYPRRTGEIYLLAYAARHRWSYVSAMEPDQVLVFKQYDSRRDDVARFTPHAAFDHPVVSPLARPRESIELRCLVTWE